MARLKNYVSRQLLIAGGGHASLPLIKMGIKWKQKNIAITLISAESFLVYTGTLPQYMGGFYDWKNIDRQQPARRWRDGRFCRRRYGRSRLKGPASDWGACREAGDCAQKKYRGIA